jgi:predicted transcriptional regulator
MSAQAVDPEAAAKMATEILVAYLSANSVETDRLPKLILEVRAAFETQLNVQAGTALDDRLSAPAAPELMPANEPRMPVQPDAEAITRSVQDDHLVSFEDGKHYRSLRRHLMAKHGMTPEDYRRKWNLPADYPMVAPSYARERSEVAKRIGLGRGDTSKSNPERRRLR